MHYQLGISQYKKKLKKINPIKDVNIVYFA